MHITRRQALVSLSATASLSLFPGCVRALLGPKANMLPKGPLSNADADALLAQFGENYLKVYPTSATYLGVDVGTNAHLRGELSDASLAGQQRIAQALAQDLAVCEKLDTSQLSFSKRTSFEVIKSAYRTALEGFAQPYGDVAVGSYRNTPYVVIQNAGAYIDTPQLLTTTQPIENVNDAEYYLSRLSGFARQLDGELERLRAATAFGLLPPNYLADRTVSQLELAMAGLKDGGAIADTLAKKTGQNGIAGEWGKKAQEIIAKEVLPALQRQKSELELQRARGTDIPGMWSRPHGEAYYHYALKASTTTSLSPDALHATGLAQVEELHARMDPILKKLRYKQGSVGERMQMLAKDPRFKFSEGDKGRAEIMAYIAKQIKILREKVIPQAFHTLVRGNLEVVRMSKEQEPGAPSAYGGAGSIDGKIPGRFLINLRSTDLHSTYSLPDLAAHEAIPGHVWQGEYANQLPLIRALLAFNAYSEGWALYAEQLADELGLYDGFEVGRLGYLQSIAFRACRLVVDTGIHAKRWSRSQAVDYFVRVNGSNPLEVANEVDRYCAWPGQACGYKVGHNQINRLRDKAKAKLGQRFDLRSFDDAVVLGGNVPLDVLELNVDASLARV